jgi:hypothetical protein
MFVSKRSGQRAGGLSGARGYSAEALASLAWTAEATVVTWVSRH